MATAFAPKQIVSFEELFMSRVAQQEALTRLPEKTWISNKEDFGGDNIKG